MFSRFKIQLLIFCALVAFGFSSDERDFTSKAQIAIIVDFSKSAQETVNAVKRCLWKLYPDFNEHYPNTKLEVALVGYSSTSFGKKNDYVRVLSQFEESPSDVFELLSQRTFKGSIAENMVGSALNAAVKNLNWSANENVPKHVFMVGNGPIKSNYGFAKKAAIKAVKKGIKVHALYVLYKNNDKNFSYWKQLVDLGDGKLKTIVSAYISERLQGEIKVNTDKMVLDNDYLNATYIPYGSGGIEALERMKSIDDYAKDLGNGCMSNRVWYKTSVYFQGKNSAWDLVDLAAKGTTNYKEIDRSFLYKEIQNLSDTELDLFIKRKAEERQDHIDLVTILTYTNREIKKDTYRNTPAYQLDLSGTILKIFQEVGI